MIVLDTNVLSAVLKPKPSGLAAQAASEVFTTTITLAEIFYGIETLPAGKRRMRLLAAVEKMFAEQFGGRILRFDEESARIVSSTDSAGRNSTL